MFKKKIEFVPAVCPKCGGRLELDSSFERAVCKDCGGEVIIRNAKRKEKGHVDKLIDFVERQQGIYREDKRKEKEELQEEERKLDIEIEKDKEKTYSFLKDNWWKMCIMLFVFMILCYVLEYLSGGGA